MLELDDDPPNLKALEGMQENSERDPSDSLDTKDGLPESNLNFPVDSEKVEKLNSSVGREQVSDVKVQKQAHSSYYQKERGVC